MKKSLLTLVLVFFTMLSHAQSLIGAWETVGDFDGQPLRSVVIFSDSYQVNTYYHAKTGAFISSNGGRWNLDGNTITETIEFDSKNKERIGSSTSFEIVFSENELSIKEAHMVWKRIDNGAPGHLAGAWLISGRMRDGALQKRDTNRPRKTMKILSGTRFQWIAYNTETKEFMGTGGGTYTTIDGKYTETIEFFSRDDSRVGASLDFDYELKDGDWHHSGLSSKGKPIYEVWSLRND